MLNFDNIKVIGDEKHSIIEIHFDKDFSGPEQDIDLLMQVRWDMISSAEHGDVASYLSARRTGPCSMVLTGVSYDELF